MANLIQIKRALTNATPASLANGELAWSGNGDILYIGNFGTVSPIAGVRNPGTLTANQALVANSTSGIDKVIVANAVITTLTANGSTGTNNQVLVSNGTVAYWSDPASSSFTLAADSGTPDTFNTGGTLTFAGGNGVVTSVTDDQISIAVGEGYGINTAADAVAVNNAEIRALISASGDLSYNVDTGVISFTNDAGDIEGVTAGDGLTGGGTTGTVTLNVVGGDGIIANANDIEVDAGDGLFTNSTGVHVGGSNTITVAANTIAVNFDTGLTADINGVRVANADASIGVGVAGIYVNDGQGLTINATGIHVGSGNGITTNSSSVAVANSDDTITVSGSGIAVNESALTIATSQLTGDIALGTSTSGAYVANVSSGNGVIITNAGGEGSTPTIVADGANGISVTAAGINVKANNGISSTSDGTFVKVDEHFGFDGSGNLTINSSADFTFNDVIVSGDLTVSGNVVSIDVANLTVEDPLIKLAKDNTAADLVDIGFYGAYEDTGTKYAGLFRDASDGSGVFKLFAGLGTEPTTTVGDVSSLLADLDVGALTASSISGSSLTLTTDLAVAHGGTGRSSFANNGIVYGQNTAALGVTAAGTQGDVLQAGAGGVPEFGPLDGGSF